MVGALVPLVVVGDPTLILATVEDVSTLENMSEYDVVPDTLTDLSDDKGVAAELGIELVSSEGMIGRPDAVKEVLAVLENSSVEDADFI